MSEFHRFLNPSETAFTYCNEQSPLSVVIAIFYQGELPQQNIREALDRLQNRHLLLQCSIQKRKGRYFFKKSADKALIPIHTSSRNNDLSWKDQTERMLNTRFDTSGPLMQVHFLPSSSPGGKAEILLNLHHALIDGISARLLLSEFLQLLGGRELPHLPPVQLNTPSYPKAFRKWSGLRKRLAFMANEMRGEIKFLRKGLNSKIPREDKNAVVSLELDRATSTRILRQSGALGISPNSLINGALLHSVYKQKGIKDSKLLRTVSFADMRNKMEPGVGQHEMGCHIAMTRFTVPVTQKSTLLSIAQDLWKRMYQAGRRGDLYAFQQLSTSIMKLSFGLQQFRLANAALSYIGPLNLQRQYGELELLNIKAFITNNHLGPSFTAFGKYLFGKISLDLNYLTSEYEMEEIEEMVADIEASLQDIV